MSPWKSQAQERWGNSPAGHKALGDKGVAEWNRATKGQKLPAKVKAGQNSAKPKPHKEPGLSPHIHHHHQSNSL